MKLKGLNRFWRLLDMMLIINLILIYITNRPITINLSVPVDILLIFCFLTLWLKERQEIKEKNKEAEIDDILDEINSV
jgi:hypothetical protein